MLLILATSEAEIRRMAIQNQPSKKAGHSNNWAQWRTPIIPSYEGGRDQENHSSPPVQTEKFARPHLNRRNWVRWYRPVILVTARCIK
jgi:hypothetical protein